jgi:hypothetical protein
MPMKWSKNILMPAKNPYNTPMVTTLAMLWMPLMAKMRTAPQPLDTAIIDLTLHRCATNPGKSRPKKLEAFMSTSCS